MEKTKYKFKKKNLIILSLVVVLLGSRFVDLEGKKIKEIPIECRNTYIIKHEREKIINSYRGLSYLDPQKVIEKNKQFTKGDDSIALIYEDGKFVYLCVKK